MNHADLSPAWSERSFLLPKHFDYVFSLEVRYEFIVDPSLGSPVPMKAAVKALQPDDPWDSFHVHGAEFVHIADGVQHQCPRFRVARAKDALAIRDEGAISLNGTLLLDTDTQEMISMTYSGVLTMDTGTVAFLDPPPASEPGPSGRVFIASTQEISNPKYRWLVQNRLIGVGRVETSRAKNANGWRLLFDYDMYIAS